MRPLAILAVLFSSIAVPAAVGAAEPPPHVVLIRPADHAPWSEEVLTRAAGELRAAGFIPVVVDAEPAEEVRSTFRRADPSAIAVIAVVSSVAEVWIDDRLTGKISIRPSQPPGASPRAASDVAIEAVELLRASLIELTVRSREAFATKEPPKAAVAFAEAALADRPGRDGNDTDDRASGPLRFGVGPAAFLGFDPLSVHLAPLFSAAVTADIGLGGHVRFVGPGAGADLEAPGGAVSWTPWVLAAGPIYEARVGSRWMARGSLDAGLFHLTAQGDLASPARSRGGSTLDAAFLAGGALGFAVSEHTFITLGLEILVTAPPPTVEVAGETLATAGRPWLLVPLALEIAP